MIKLGDVKKFKSIYENKVGTQFDNAIHEMEKEEFSVNAIPVPKGATNGDVIRIMFPNLEVEIEGNNITCWIDEHRWFAPDYDWWNAPYKKDKGE